MTTGVPTPTEGAIDSNPYIVLVSGLHGEVLHDEFRRYVRDYELVVAESAASALDLVERLAVEGRQIALFVVDFELPDSTGLDTVLSYERSFRQRDACSSHIGNASSRRSQQ